MTSLHPVSAALLAAALLAVPGAPRAERAPAELEIDAERVELDRGSGRASFTGAVRLRHGELELRCDRLEAEVDGQGRLTAVVASGGVRLSAGNGVSATAGGVRYEPGSGRVVLTGSPSVRSASGTLTGRSVVIHLEDGRVAVEGARGVFRVR